MAKEGLRKPLKSLKKGLKSAHTKFYLTFFKNSSETTFVPYFIFKLKMKRNSKNIFYYFLGQKPFSPFLKEKIFKKTIIMNLFLAIVL